MPLGNRNNPRARTGNNDCIRLGNVLKRIGRREQDADGGPNRSWLLSTDQKAIPGHTEFGTFKAKDFRCHGQLKRIDSVVHNGRDRMHGSFLMLLVFSATGRSVSFMAKS